MGLFVCELKKLMVKRCGFLIIALFFLTQLGALLLLDIPANAETEACREDYKYYLSKVEGPLTGESIALIGDISRKMQEADVEIPRLYNSFYDGDITKEELEQQAAPYEEAQSRKAGFDLLYEQFIYAREDPGKRYLLYTNGWNALLTDGTLNILFIGLLLLAVAPLFCHEYHSGMDVLNLTTRRGAERMTLAKLMLAAAVVTLLCVLSSALEYSFYGLRYGLPHGDYPLQSLPHFSASSKSLTLLQAFLWMAASRWFGSLIFAGMILFLSVLLKKYTLTLVLSTSLLILPYYAVSSEIRYVLPGPLPFLLGTGLLRGTETAADPLTQQEVVLFHEITGGALCLLIGAALLLMAAMLYVIFHKTSAAWRVGRKRAAKYRVTAILLPLVLLVSLAGCTDGNDGGAQYDIYNVSHRNRFENERYTVWFDEESQAILFQDKEIGRQGPLVRDPLLLSSTIGQCVYGNGRHVYYFRNDYDKSGRYDGVERVSLIEVDTNTFQERTVFEDTQSPLRHVFFGRGINSLFDASGRQGPQAFLQDVWAFFIGGNTLYLLGNDVKTICLPTGRMDTLDGPRPTKGSLAFDGRTLYYTTDRLQVEAHDTKTGEVQVIPNLITEFFFLTDTRFLYINRADEYRLYAMDRENGTAVRLTDRPVLWFETDGAFIHYTGRFDRRSYRIDADGKNETPVEGLTV